jgi:magnesium transporter
VDQHPLCLRGSDLDQVASHLQKKEFFWLDMEDPTAEEIKRLESLLSLHPLTIQAVSTFSERPKREHYDGYVSMVVYGVDSNVESGGSLLREVHALISGDWVVTLHPAPFKAVEELRDDLKQRTVRGELALVYEILETVLSTYGPVLDRIDDQIDDIEDAVIKSAREESLQKIFSLKRDLIGMRRVVLPMRDFFARDSDEIAHLPGMEADDSLYFRDLYDGLVRASELIDSYRDLLSGAADMYLSTVANRQGEISKQLTIIATIFLPLSFLTGFFGQNFAFLTNHIINHTWTFFVFGIGLLLVSVGALRVFFSRKGWLTPDVPDS